MSQAGWCRREVMMQGRTGEVEPLEGVVQVAASLAPAPRVVVQVRDTNGISRQYQYPWCRWCCS